jgi:hypothetical protein
VVWWFGGLVVWWFGGLVVWCVKNCCETRETRRNRASRPIVNNCNATGETCRNRDTQNQLKRLR